MEEIEELIKIGEAILKVGERIFATQKENLEELGKLRDELKTDEAKKLLDKTTMEIFEGLVTIEKENKSMKKQIIFFKKML